MDLVPDCTVDLFPPKDLCLHEGLSISQRRSVLDLKTQSYAEDMLLPIHAAVASVRLWFLILLDEIGDSPPCRSSTHEGFTSDTFNLISHGLVAEYECISFHKFLPAIQRGRRKKNKKKKRHGSWWQSTLESCLGATQPLSWNKILWHMLLRHWQTMINKQTFTQCDIFCSLTLSPLVPLGCLSSSSRGEWSRTEHDRNTVKADGFMSQSFCPAFHPATEFLRRWEDVITPLCFWAASTSPSLLHYKVPNVYRQPSVSDARGCSSTSVCDWICQCFPR